MSSLFPNHNSLPGGIQQYLTKFLIRVFFNFKKVSSPVFTAAGLLTSLFLFTRWERRSLLRKCANCFSSPFSRFSFPESSSSLVHVDLWSRRRRGEGRAGKVGMKEESSLFCQKGEGLLVVERQKFLFIFLNSLVLNDRVCSVSIVVIFCNDSITMFCSHSHIVKKGKRMRTPHPFSSLRTYRIRFRRYWNEICSCLSSSLSALAPPVSLPRTPRDY